MRNGLSVIVGILCLAPICVPAKPLLTNSQDTYASACIRNDDTARRLLEICQRALLEAGASIGQRIEILNVLGWAYYDLDQYDAAKSRFSEVLGLDSGSHVGHLGMAWIAYVADAYDEAEKHFRKSIERTPTGGGIAGLGAALYWADRIDLEEYQSHLDTGLALTPKNRWILREKGWALTDNGQPDAALEFFRRAIEIYDEDANALYGLATTLSDLNRDDEALTHINKALEVDSDSFAMLRQRSLILLRLDRPRQAMKDAEKLVALGPEQPDGYVYVARARDALGKREDAIRGLEAAAKHLQETTFLNYWRAWMLFQDEAFDEALQIARRTSGMADADAVDYQLHARIALELNALDEAGEMIDKALKDNTNSSWIRYYQALYLVARGEFDRAERTYDTAIVAGLPDWTLSDFLSALVKKDRFMQAIKMRIRYVERSVVENAD